MCPMHRRHTRMSILKDSSIWSIANDPSDCNLDEDRLGVAGVGAGAGLGPKRIVDALRNFEAPGQIFALTLTELEGLRLPGGGRAVHLSTARHGELPNRSGRKWFDAGRDDPHVWCPEYPERLKEIYDPPPVLWVRGAVELAGAAVDCEWWARGILRPMGRVLRRCWRAIWRRGGC